jgi:hypothetical protein
LGLLVSDILDGTGPVFLRRWIVGKVYEACMAENYTELRATACKQAVSHPFRATRNDKRVAKLNTSGSV